MACRHGPDMQHSDWLFSISDINQEVKEIQVGVACRHGPDMQHSDWLFSISDINQEVKDDKWVWLVDMARTCSILIGHCLGGMLVGEQLSLEEKNCLPWLENHIFRNGASSAAAKTSWCY